MFANFLGIALGMSAMLAIPAIMVFLSVELDKAVRQINIVIAISFFGFNLVGLPAYPSAYDKFLIVSGLIFNAFTIYYMWSWS
jgi:hypothetical protein